MKINKFTKIIFLLFLFIILSQICLNAENSNKREFEDSLSEIYINEKALYILQNTDKFQFYIVLDQKMSSEELNPISSDEKIIKSFPHDNEVIIYYKVKKNEVINGSDISSAKLLFDEFGYPTIKLNFNEKGKKLLAEVSENNIFRQMAIVFDNEVYSAPRIQSPLTDGTLNCAGLIRNNNSYSSMTHITRSILTNFPILHFYIIEKEADFIEELGNTSTDEIILRNPINSKKNIFYKIKNEDIIKSTNILNIKYIYNNNDYQVIMIEFKENSKALISDFTEKNIGKKLALVLNNVVYSSPIITSKITDSILNFRIEK